jgi:hypothetical protein
MPGFIQQHAEQVSGVLTGFDRVRLRGTLRWLSNPRGMLNYLSLISVLLKDFKAFAMDCTAQIRRASQSLALSAGRPFQYLNSSALRKEELVSQIATRDRVESGLICVLSCVEPCYSYAVGPNREQKRLELRYGPSKCRHDYFYVQDPELGRVHLRLQTWFPFTLHVCLNGRDWLARQLTAAGLGFQQRDNCFVEVEDFGRAQALLDEQLRTRWNGLLNRLTQTYHPTHRQLFREYPIPYYWSVEESEWATDVVFRSPQALAALYPRLVRHALTDVSSADVMRFLSRRMPRHGGVNGNFQGEVISDVRTRPEGTRVKHRLNRNAIKMYDKQPSVLRVETTINDARDMKVYRRAEGDPQSPKRWRPLRKGVADLHRRAKLSQAANERYLEKLAAVDDSRTLQELVAPLCRPVQWRGQRVRALSPLSPGDTKLLQAVQRGEFAIHGFRNRDLRTILHGEPADPAQTRRQSAAITRQIRLLRAHALIAKVPKTHRYQITDLGRAAITALLQAQQANAAQLQQLAA